MLPDPGLGIAVDFPQKEFEDAIRFAMQMGTPVDPDKRPKFVFASIGKTYWKVGVQLVSAPAMDWDGNPLDPEIETRVDAPRTVSVDCGIEVTSGASRGETPIGGFPAVQLTVTLLEADWAKVAGCDSVQYNGDTYLYDSEPSNVGLFSAGVHTMVFVSKDET